jgi:hypothetical protein
MNTIELPGIDGRSALGFLAAIGAANLLNIRGGNVLLSWSPRDATARLHSDSYADVDAVAAELVEVVAALSDVIVVPGGPPGLPPPGEAPDKLRLPPADLRRQAELLIDAGDPAVVQAWLTSLVTDLALDSQGRSAHTLFGAFSGKQSMYTMLTKPLALVRQHPTYLREALVGWRRVAGVTGEYLDHRVLFDAADSPLGESMERGVPGATWLALMSFPLIRTTSVDGTRPISTGWYRTGRRVRLRWPLWRDPLDLAAICALWESPLLTQAARRDDMRGESVLPKDELTRRTLVAGDNAYSKLEALGVFLVARAERRRVPGRNFAGVLAPV